MKVSLFQKKEYFLLTRLAMVAVLGMVATLGLAMGPEVQAQGNQPGGQLLSAHTGEIAALAFSTTGRLLASGGDDQVIRLWDPHTGQELRQLQGHTDSVRSLAFSADGQLLVSGSTDNTVRVWEVESGRAIKTLPGRFGAIRGVAFSPDAQSVASVGDDSSLRLWDWRAGKETKALRTRFGIVFTVGFSPDGLSVVSGGMDGVAHLWDLATFRERRAFTGPQGAVYTAAFTPDGTRLVTGGADGVVRLWDVAGGQEWRALSGHTGAVHAVTVSTDGRSVASAGADGTVRLWEIATGSERLAVSGQSGPVFAVALSPDGSWLASGGRDRIVRLVALTALPTAPPVAMASPTPTAKHTPLQQGTGTTPQQPATMPAPARAEPPPAPSAPPPSLPPVIALATPTDGQQVAIDRISLMGAAASDKGVARVEIRVNGQLLAQREASRGTSRANLDFAEQVALQEGRNDIVVTAIDRHNGTASRTMTVHRVVNKGQIWGVVIGISRYKTVASLKYGDKDAMAMYDYLRQHIGVPTDNLTLLTNEQATLFNVRRVLGTELKRKAGTQDTVIIYYAGHGAPESDASSPDGDGLEKYLVLYDADPQDLYTTGMPMREMEIIFQRLAAERVIFIADSCFSGATLGRTISTGLRRAVTVSDAFLPRLSRGKGRVVLTASRASEVSEEREDFGHGVFTYYLLEGLKGKADQDGDRIITVDEVYNYVSQKVPAATANNQHPLKKGEVEGQLILGRMR
jgi:hypothetical protein